MNKEAITIKITGCSHGGWYRDMIGQTYTVFEDSEVEYICRANDGFLNFILKKDCEVLEFNNE